MPVPVPPNAKRIFKSQRHELWEWDQELYDGSHAVFSCAIRGDTVAVIPFLDKNTVLLIKESQPGRSVPFMDVPGGMIDSEERPEDTAKRELREETGYQASVLQFRENAHLGMTRFVEYVYLAKNLTNGQAAHLDAGEKIELMPTPWKEAVAMSLRGELRRHEAMLAILAMEFDPEARALKERFLNS